jgi:hypothetical protein
MYSKTISPRLCGAQLACAGWSQIFGEALAFLLSFRASGRPALPLLPLWEKGAGGKRGKGAQGCRKPLITPKNSTFERLKPSAMLCEARLRGLKQMYFLS